jgi:predicted anti-sigma-YlaC factor YlaD
VTCQELLEQLSDYLDEDARAELCRQIDEHLARCHDCRIVVDKTKRTIILYQADHVETPPHVSDRLQEALAREYAARAERSGG